MSFVFWIFLTFDPFLGGFRWFQQLAHRWPTFEIPPQKAASVLDRLYHPVARYDPVARLRAYDLRLHEARLNASVFVTDLCEGRWGMVGKRYGQMGQVPPNYLGAAFGKCKWHQWHISILWASISEFWTGSFSASVWVIFTACSMGWNEEKMPCGCHVARVFQDINW